MQSSHSQTEQDSIASSAEQSAAFSNLQLRCVSYFLGTDADIRMWFEVVPPLEMQCSVQCWVLGSSSMDSAVVAQAEERFTLANTGT